MEQNIPLVSICVITYNSAKYVVETLDSAKSQTYKNIELIISDDCSTDNTVEICKKWIECNGSVFKRIELLQSATNTGVSANLNRAYSACKGEWVKAIAGDDILVSNCIESLLSFASNFDGEKVIIGAVLRPFREVNGEKHYSEYYSPIEKMTEKFANLGSAVLQNKALLFPYYPLMTPTLFYKSSIIDDIKYNEDYRFFEDHPFMLSASEKQYRYVHIDKELVLYRLHDKSITGQGGRIFGDFYKYRRCFDVECRFPYIPFYMRWGENYEYYLKKTLSKLNLNRNNILCRCIYGGLSRMNIFSYITKIKFRKFLNKGCDL